MSAPLGAIIEDVDVKEVDQARWQELNSLFCQYKVLVFRCQDLSPEEHINFARRWGELVQHPYAGLEDYPDIIELKNKGKKKDVNQHWHSDMSYNHTPPKLTMLYALEAPSIGGDTAFSNQVLAYQNLSQGLKNVIDQLQAVHTAAGLAELYRQDAASAPRAEHPVARIHDDTGEKALYVCRAFTRRFTGWSKQESDPLLQYLFQHSIRPEYQARHQWARGDLVMWDNRALLHFAVHDHEDEPRVIHRLQVEGAVPI
jgi:alpha-ketoglutarate-dependent taurine dioxygenase